MTASAPKSGDGGARTLAQIAGEVCQRHDVSLRDLRGREQSMPLQRARREFMALAYAETNHSRGAIGRWLGARDSTTVRDAIEAHQRRAAFA